MTSRSELLFWAKCWVEARRTIRRLSLPALIVPDIAMTNYAIYLAEVYSWMRENRKVKS